MDAKKIINTYIDIVKTKYLCFEGTATQEELISYIAVWIAGSIALAVVAIILGFIGLGIVGLILCTVWNLGNLLPGIGTIVRFLNSKKVQ